jgi:hypothetical protein
MMKSLKIWRYVAALATGAAVVACGASDRYAVSPEDAEDANDRTWTVTREPHARSNDAGASEIAPVDGGTDQIAPESTDAVDAPNDMTADASVDASPTDSGESTMLDAIPGENAQDGSLPPTPEATAPEPPSQPPAPSSPRVRWTTSGEHDTSPADVSPRRGRRPVESKSFFLNLALAHGGLFGSDFEGTTALVAPDSSGVAVALVPKPGADTGVLASIGVGRLVRGRAGYSVGLEYSQTWMSTTLGGVELGNGKLVEVALPFRVLVSASDLIVPYFEVGTGLVTWWVENASGSVGYDGQLLSDPEESKSTGLSFDFGVGAAVLLTDYFGIELGLGYRALFFGEVNDRPLDDDLDAGRWLVRVGPSLQL